MTRCLRYLFLAVLICWAPSTYAHDLVDGSRVIHLAQVGQIYLPKFPHVAATYTGPGDVVTSGWYTYPCLTRAFSAATTGTSCVLIERASDSTTTTINTLSNGTLDTATASTFCASTTCYLKEAYDKSGNSINWTTSATLANDPVLTFSCNGTLPCFKFKPDTTHNTYDLQTPSTQRTQPWTMTLVAKVDDVTYISKLMFDYCCSGTFASNYIGLESSTGGPLFYAGTLVQGPSGTWVNKWVAMSGVGNGASGIFTRNGTQSTGSYGTQNLPPGTSTPYLVIDAYTSGGTADGYVEEAGVLSVGLSTTQACSLNDNQDAYYGISGTC